MGVSLKVIIDRFEGEYAVCEKEDRTMIHIEREKLPRKAKEGAVLVISGDRITLDVQDTKARVARIKEKMKGLWE